MGREWTHPTGITEEIVFAVLAPTEVEPGGDRPSVSAEEAFREERFSRKTLHPGGLRGF